ncbi:MAG: cysteine desulfurase, partial [Betaproteobacteria bacterium AqS2]|nr:cysteine desulfurase [Betaproteobacteria bacterium AqS2]
MRAYFDHNATAPLDAEVRAAMAACEEESYGNAASRHAEGRAAHEAVERARAQVARAVNARPEEVIFTSSGTESNNLLVKGVAARSTKKVVAASGVEHPCVLCAARAVADGPGEKVFMPLAVDAEGVVELADVEAALASGDVALLSVMLANNESGVLQDVAALAKLAAGRTAVHTDAAQALGKIEVDFAALGVDAMTLSAHKARGPKGIAALIAKEELEFAPLHDGGGQEKGLRSGTLNVAGIVGFGVAAELAAARAAAEGERLAGLRTRLEERLRADGATIFGAGAARLPNTTYFGYPGIEGESLVVMLDQNGFALASGSACASTKNEPSHVLLAMGCTEEQARTAVRCSLGLESDAEQV